MSGPDDSNASAERELRRIQVDLYQGLNDDVDKLYGRTEKNGNSLSRIDTQIETHEKRLDHHDHRITRLEESKHTSSDDHQALRLGPATPHVQTSNKIPWLVVIFVASMLLTAIIISALITGRDAGDLTPALP